VSSPDAPAADAIVVGSGASGGFAAKELTEAGLHVLLLEAGERRTSAELPPVGVSLDRSPEFLTEAAERQSVQLRHSAFARQTRHLFVDDVEHPYTTPDARPFDWIRSLGEGGRTLVWGGVTLRLTDTELGAGWPLGYDELSPYYDEVEQFLGVCEKPLTPAEARLAEAVKRRWPERQLLGSRGIERSGLTSLDSSLRAARQTGRLRVRSGALVRSIETHPDGRRATGVVFVDRATGREEVARARVIFLCASTIESTRILLCSELGAASPALGHYLMDHPSLSVLGNVPDADATNEPLGGPFGVYMPRFRNEGGYMIWGGIGRRHPALDRPACFVFHASGEMLSRYENGVTLDPDTRDAWGTPVARISCAFGEDERRLMTDARQALHELVSEAGLEVDSEDPVQTPGGWVHEVGSARMGNDPASSVLDAFNRVWQLPNVYVTDGASFPTSGCENPTLTMMALSLRAARDAVSRLGRGEL
jgi:choline dehydrogenase-like flavoprotein